MTTLLILTGPQGSGNHLFSKIFALDKQVNGWSELNKTYWIGHDQEPFVNMWKNSDLVEKYNWQSHEYHVTSISCPFKDNGKTTWPNYTKFIKAVEKQGIKVKIGIIGRDQNILAYQENRLRGSVTYYDFFRFLPELLKYESVFLSQELLYLYERAYLQQISKQLDFPIDYGNSLISEILKDDANKKYLQPVESNWLDPLIIKASNAS